RVSDQLWERLAPLLADPPRRFRHPGRARYQARACLEGILYVLYTDTPWLELPYRELGRRRPASPPPLAGRTHQRLAESKTPHRHATRPQSRQLPRLPPPRHDPRTQQLILR